MNNTNQLKEELADERADAMMVLSKMINHFMNAVYADKEVITKISELEAEINDLARQMQKLMFNEIDEANSERN